MVFEKSLQQYVVNGAIPLLYNWPSKESNPCILNSFVNKQVFSSDLQVQQCQLPTTELLSFGRKCSGRHLALRKVPMSGKNAVNQVSGNLEKIHMLKMTPAGLMLQFSPLQMPRDRDIFSVIICSYFQACFVRWLPWSRHSYGNNVERSGCHGCSFAVDWCDKLPFISAVKLVCYRPEASCIRGI